MTRSEFSAQVRKDAWARCSLPECGNEIFAKGLCQKHYARLLRHGDPNGGQVEEGAAIAWLEANKRHAADDCLAWPFNMWGGVKGRLKFMGRKMAAARAMCILAHGAPMALGLEAAHGCGNAQCVNPRHLRWATKLENEADKEIHGTRPRGSCVTGSKLSQIDVAEIRGAHPDAPKAFLALKYGVNRKTISNIQNGKTWRWLA